MQTLRKIVTGVFVGVFLISMAVGAAAQDTFSTEPVTNNGQKWRIGYYEGGEYIDYQQIFMATLQSLMDLGGMEPMEIPPQKGTQTKDLWKWLATEAESDYLEFVADAHYTAEWDEDLRSVIVEEIITRLNEQQDIDLMLAFGTWAGQDLANDKHHTNLMVLSASDPIASGIVKSVEDSGYEHVHARVDPYRFRRQVQVFYDIVGFQKLGIAYEDSVAGRSYAAISDIEAVAEESGFEIVRCLIQTEEATKDLIQDSLKACFRELGDTAEAIYVTTHQNLTPQMIPELVEIANSKGIPTFSQSGSEEVKYGFLFSISQAGFKYLGDFFAQTMAKIFNGANPGELEQLFESPPKIAINLKTSEIIGYDPPVDVLGAVDEIYQEVTVPEAE
jgi:ABC-type uncharacterized transport system substrate-binding protein